MSTSIRPAWSARCRKPGAEALLDRDDYQTFCASLIATTHVVQWGGADVWKVGGKVFAIATWSGKYAGLTFKVSPTAWDLLKETPGCRPAPYLASRGMKWIQAFEEPGLSDDDLKAYLAESHRIVGRA
ncbi:MAG: MmcQ/YjbR family DNA-binding protein [Magnetovibrionaceae bacterium]